MKPKVLMVDDEKNILEAYERNLRGKFEVTAAESGQLALKAIGEMTYQVIVTDYKMPVMNGVELLDEVRAAAPETVQIMLTGQADMQAVIDLINKGKIFRFLTKPCSPEDLAGNITDAARQYALVTAERELLGKTLGGSIRVLTDILALAKPQAFHRAQRIRGVVSRILQELNYEQKWQIEIAAMLSQIGCVTIPDDVLKHAYGKRKLSGDEQIMFQNHPVIAADMIKNIPRLENVAEIVKYQEKCHNGEGFPVDDVKGDDIPFGSRVLKIVIDYDAQIVSGIEPMLAYEDLLKKKGIYDEEILEKAKNAFVEIVNKRKRFYNKELPVEHLMEGMYLAEDVMTASGVILGTKNQKISLPLIATLKNYEKNKQIKGLLKLIVPFE